MVVDLCVLVAGRRRPEILRLSLLDLGEREALIEEPLVVVGPVDARELDVLDLVDELGRVVHTLERRGRRADMDGRPVGALSRDNERRESSADRSLPSHGGEGGTGGIR